MESNKEEKPKRSISSSTLSKKVASAAVFIAVGLILSYINPFGYFYIFGTKINPFAHFINAITGVLLGLSFSLITATGIAIIRFSVGIGSIHAFHGGMAGALVVGTIAYILKRKAPKYVRLATFTEPIGTVFIGGTIGYFIVPVSGDILAGLLFYWGLFAASSIPGCILGYLMLFVINKSGLSWEDYYQKKKN
jgi:energy coupling factor transporter S component ThiW